MSDDQHDEISLKETRLTDERDVTQHTGEIAEEDDEPVDGQLPKLELALHDGHWDDHCARSAVFANR